MFMAEGKLPKPQLRDLHLSRVRRTLGIAALLCTFTGMSWKILVTDRYERKAEEFYKTYDPMKSLQIMNEAGLMESYN
ncbi:Cytochrome c oxidase subunit [Apis cerana cerana]|uniref:Cytochrome c oxidase subunit n=1 Tax=Apis cerana cerana TaxID=94128 RepID=A0A2A3ECK2_APICC|nr:Cytochrome c oxidase subunit [Apis cerana cerana]